MTATFACWMHRSARLALTITLAVTLTNCSMARDVTTAAADPSASWSVTLNDAARGRVVLRFDGHTVPATLSDTPQAREFAAMLPLTVHLKDAWGQAKSGRIPRPLTVETARPVHDPVPGGIYFWPETEVLAIYYDDLGQSVPDPGLVQLGVVETGLDALADAGCRFTVAIELAAAPTF